MSSSQANSRSQSSRSMDEYQEPNDQFANTVLMLTGNDKEVDLSISEDEEELESKSKFSREKSGYSDGGESSKTRNPGAFRVGGGSSRTQIRTDDTTLSSRDATIDSAQSTNGLVSAELVHPATVVEYVEAEPLQLNSGRGDEEEGRSGTKASKNPKKSYMKWKYLLPLLLLLLAGIIVAVVVVVLSPSRTGDDNSNIGNSQEQEDKNGNGNGENTPDSGDDTQNDDGSTSSNGGNTQNVGDGDSESSGIAAQFISIHGAVWGHWTDCDRFDASSLQITCQMELEVLMAEGAVCSVSGNVGTCDTTNNTAAVLFQCANDVSDTLLEANITMAATEAKKCSNQQRRRARMLSDSDITVAFGGSAQMFMALGRFCLNSNSSLLLENNSTCQSGQSIQGHPPTWTTSTSSNASLPNYCVSKNTCQTTTTCKAGELSSCSTDCDISLNSLEISDQTVGCVFNGTGFTIDKESYWKMIQEQMF